jgi:hypothetical protein
MEYCEESVEDKKIAMLYYFVQESTNLPTLVLLYP